MEVAFAEQEAGKGELCKDQERRERGYAYWRAVEQEEQARERERKREGKGDVVEDDGKGDGDEGWEEDFLEMWERNEDSREEVLRLEMAVEEWMREERMVREGAAEGGVERAT